MSDLQDENIQLGISNYFLQRPGSIFHRLVGSVTRSMRQRRASSISGLVASDETNSQNGLDKAYLGRQRYVIFHFLIKKALGFRIGKLSNFYLMI
jgi:hypothetical protein